MAKNKKYRRKRRMASHSRNAKDLQAVALALLALEVRMEYAYGTASARRRMCSAAIAAVQALYQVLKESEKKECPGWSGTSYPDFPLRKQLPECDQFPVWP